MKHWNYRILAEEYEDQIEFSIHEVYYDENDKPRSYSCNATPIISDSRESLKWQYQKFGEAFTKPILYKGKKWPQVYNEI